jgi:TldD protein
LKRKDFLQLSAMGVGGMMLPDLGLFGRSIDASQLLNDGMDVSLQKTAR